MILNVKQGTKDSKKDYLDLLDYLVDNMGYKLFNISCYDKKNKLSEATLIKDKGDLQWE